MSQPLVEVKNLAIAFGDYLPVQDVSFSVQRGETVGIVGESGSGKSLSCRSIMRMLPGGAQIARGSVMFDSQDVLAMSRSELRRFRRRRAAMVFQDPFSSLNPSYTIGHQLTEVLTVCRGMGKREAIRETVQLIERVEIPDGQRISQAYPDELSGGMRQRVMIAMALAAEPQLLIADEATTALDVTTQADILALLVRLQEETGMAILLISHDFGVVAQMCAEVVVLYGGHTLEVGEMESVYRAPTHPYTRGLLQSIPSLESAGQHRRRQGIPGQPPGPRELLHGCPFAPRCPIAREECKSMKVELQAVGQRHLCACPYAVREPLSSLEVHGG